VELKYALAAAFCDWIVGICDATTNNIKSIHSIPARKIVRVYNGADPMLRVTKEQWPAKTGFTLVYVGRLEPVKNHSLLLHAFCLALKSMPACGYGWWAMAVSARHWRAWPRSWE